MPEPKYEDYKDQVVVPDYYQHPGVPENSRFLEDPKTHYRYGWDTVKVPRSWGERESSGKYRSWVLKPIGSGARGPNPKHWMIVERKTVAHSQRAQARRRALKLYATAIGDMDKPKRDRRPRYECSECGNRNPFYDNDYICIECRDARS